MTAFARRLLPRGVGTRLAVGSACLFVVALAILEPGTTSCVRLALLGTALVAAWQISLHGLRFIPPKARQLLNVLLTFGAAAAAAHLAPGTSLVFGTVFLLGFVYVGLTFHPGTVLAIAPIASALWVVMDAPLDKLELSRLPLSAGVWLIVGVLLSLHTRTNAQARELLTFAANHDPLTGLRNRQSFDAILGELATGDAVVFVDLDHFKKVNDTYGHAVGDRILQDFGRVALSILRTRDVGVRYGGEEILLILPGAQASGADRALRRLRTAWAVAHEEVTFSAGVAVVTAGGEAAIERADKALYEAKRRGRNRWVHADTDLVPRQLVSRLSKESGEAVGALR
jgi:diguanylate cyclase (GGDEF)-like protein